MMINGRPRGRRRRDGNEQAATVDLRAARMVLASVTEGLTRKICEIISIAQQKL